MIEAEFSQCNELLFVSAALTLMRSRRPPCYACRTCGLSNRRPYFHGRCIDGHYAV